MDLDMAQVKFDANGLVPAVVQDVQTRAVLTVAYMNAESLQRTLETRETWFWSRSRQTLWHKGETSGNTQRVVELLVDCDEDALVVLVTPDGPACHTGEQSCFHHSLGAASQPESATVSSAPPAQSPGDKSIGAILDEVYAVIAARQVARPAGSYTSYLFNEGLDKILKKVGEESAETIIAAKNDETSPLVAETADLIFHLLVLLVERGITLDELSRELTRRRGGGK